MKNFKRKNIMFSLCGLNCGLCSMRLGNHCPGCGGGEQHSCTIAKCSLKHNGVEYCFECSEFPCDKYNGIDEYDSFITHRNQLTDIQKAKTIGIENYNKEQIEKTEILNNLLENYNAGRQKTFFCLAVNLLELHEIKSVMDQLNSKMEANSFTIKEKAACAMSAFGAIADERGILLKLKKKSK